MEASSPGFIEDAIIKKQRKAARRGAAGALACIAAAGPAWAVEEIVVVGTTPVPGMTVSVDKVPGNVQTLRAADLSENGPASLTNGLSTHLGSVNINDTLADVFQSDILYRGFEASPVLGTPQGLAVYQSGVRINEAFGDTVNWDLFPAIAIDRVDIVSANPLFGLNALGGAVSVTMKNGFTFHGGDGELSGGSFDQRQGAADLDSMGPRGCWIRTAGACFRATRCASTTRT
jgi:outer membrane cobalamin receptor